VQTVVVDDFAEPVTTDYHLVDEIEKDFRFRFPAATGRGSGVRLFSPTGAWYRVYCDGDLVLVPEGGPPVSVEGLILEAIDSIAPPDPDLSVTPHHGRHLVQAPSWLAVDPGTWQALGASASAGRVVVTATLTPSEMAWDLGNGDLQVCDNPGVVWQAGLSEAESTCSYTYTWPSIDTPDNTYDLSGTIRYEVSYTTNAPGNYGPFVPVERTTVQTIEVVEIQAVNR
jgi:hypothetical protein